MRAIILAGGKGTRLAPYNTVFPKPLVPLGDQPILEIIIRQLEHYGFKDIVLSLGYLAELIEAYLNNRSAINSKAKFTYVREEKPLGTVGSLALVPGLNETFISINGDTLTTLDYGKLVQFHKEHGALLTIAMNQRDVQIDLGVVDVNSNYEIKKFTEKPKFHYNACMGIYVYEPEVLRYITAGECLDFPQLVWQMLDNREKIIGYPSDDYWLDLGSHADYGKAQDEFESLKEKLLPMDL